MDWTGAKTKAEMREHAEDAEYRKTRTKTPKTLLLLTSIAVLLMQRRKHHKKSDARARPDVRGDCDREPARTDERRRSSLRRRFERGGGVGDREDALLRSLSGAGEREADLRLSLFPPRLGLWRGGERDRDGDRGLDAFLPLCLPRGGLGERDEDGVRESRRPFPRPRGGVTDRGAERALLSCPRIGSLSCERPLRDGSRPRRGGECEVDRPRLPVGDGDRDADVE